MTGRAIRAALLAALGTCIVGAQAPSSAPDGEDIIVEGRRIRIEGGLWRFDQRATLGWRPLTTERCVDRGDPHSVLLQLLDQAPRMDFGNGDRSAVCTPLRYRVVGAALRGWQHCTMVVAGSHGAASFQDSLRFRAELGDDRIDVRYHSTGSNNADRRVRATRIGNCGPPPEVAAMSTGAIAVQPPAPVASPSPIPRASPSEPDIQIVRQGDAGKPERPSHAISPPASTASRPDDIVVIARRLRRLQLHYASTGRVLHWCHADISSGDRRVDRIGCAILRACVREGNDTQDTALACMRRKIDEVEADAG